MKKSESQFNTNVNNGNKAKSLSRFELSKKLFLETTNNGERDFYSIKRFLNKKLRDAGKKGLYDDDLLHVVYACGWDI